MTLNTGYMHYTELQRTFEHGRLERVRTGGGWIDTWPFGGFISAVLGNATAITLEIAQARRTQVSHRIIDEEPTPPYAKVGDRFILRGRGGQFRYFYVTHVEDPGDLGEVVIYSVWEDTDRGRPVT